MTTETLSRQEMRTLEEKGRRVVEKSVATLERLEVEYVSVTAIHPNPYNPNRQTERDFELLQRSIREDGFTQPILVHRQTKEIIDGEHRWRAMNHLGFDEIPVVFVDMTAEQMRISTLRHNRARGSEDIELTIEMLRDLRELGALDHAVDSLMMDDLELQALLDDIPAPELMANDTFSQAWEPTNIEDINELETATKKKRISTTPSAAETVDQYEQRLEDEGGTHIRRATLERKIVVMIDSVTVSWGNEDAVVVRQVLGKSPSQNLLELCMREVEADPKTYADQISFLDETVPMTVARLRKGQAFEMPEGYTKEGVPEQRADQIERSQNE